MQWRGKEQGAVHGFLSLHGCMHNLRGNLTEREMNEPMAGKQASVASGKDQSQAQKSIQRRAGLFTKSFMRHIG
jgi:hypothetical protein